MPLLIHASNASAPAVTFSASSPSLYRAKGSFGGLGGRAFGDAVWIRCTLVRSGNARYV